MKTEPTSYAPEPPIEVEDDAQHIQVVNTHQDNTMGIYEDDYSEYENYEEAGYDAEVMTSNTADGNKGELSCHHKLV